MGIDIEKAELRKLIDYSSLMSEVAKKSLDDPDTIKDIAGEVADKISDELEDDPEFKRKILLAAMKREVFRKKVIQLLAEKIS